jgi:glucose-1-phosphate cytidylyltransferase
MTNGGKNLKLKTCDITDWTIHFVDTGLYANVGQRLKAIEPYIEGDPVFMANYADGLTDFNLAAMVDLFQTSGKIASFICAKLTQSFHVVDVGDEGLVSDIRYVRDSNLLINGGFFIFRREIFNYIRPGEELVIEPFQRLIAEKQLIGYRVDKFWCMDTFKDHQELNDMYDKGNAPWALWKASNPVDV